MKNFVELIEPMVLTKGVDDFTRPGRQQREAAAEFPSMLESTGLHLWVADRTPSSGEKRLVIGVATWSHTRS